MFEGHRVGGSIPSRSAIKTFLKIMTKKLFSYLDVWPRLTYTENKEYEYNLYYGNKYNLNSGQTRFSLYPESVEDLFKLMSYFTSKGWFNKITFRHNFLSGSKIKPYWMTCRKTKKIYDKEPSVEDLDRNGCLEFWITVDKKNLEEFRTLLKEIPEFKVTWVDNVEKGIDKLL